MDRALAMMHRVREAKETSAKLNIAREFFAFIIQPEVYREVVQLGTVMQTIFPLAMHPDFVNQFAGDIECAADIHELLRLYAPIDIRRGGLAMAMGLVGTSAVSLIDGSVIRQIMHMSMLELCIPRMEAIMCLDFAAKTRLFAIDEPTRRLWDLYRNDEIHDWAKQWLVAVKTMSNFWQSRYRIQLCFECCTVTIRPESRGTTCCEDAKQPLSAVRLVRASSIPPWVDIARYRSEKIDSEQWQSLCFMSIS